MEGRFWTGQIGAILLTEDGTAATDPCRVEVSGADAFANPDDVIRKKMSAGGKAIFEGIERAYQGIDLELRFPCHIDVYRDIVDLLRDSWQAGNEVRLILTGPYEIDVMISRDEDPKKWAEAGKDFSGDWLKMVTFRVVTTGAGV